MKLKIKAMSSESKASAWIVGSLPFIVFVLIWFINGKYMQNFFVDERLMIAGGGGMVLDGRSACSSWPRWSTSRSEGRLEHDDTCEPDRPSWGSTW